LILPILYTNIGNLLCLLSRVFVIFYSSFTINSIVCSATSNVYYDGRVKVNYDGRVKVNYDGRVEVEYDKKINYDGIIII